MRRVRAIEIAVAVLLTAFEWTGCSVALDRAPLRSAPPSAAPATPPAPPVGQLADFRGLPVLRLAGSPRDMGFQHGRELAARIKEGFEEFVVNHRCHGIRARYELIARRVDEEVELPEGLRAELDGMLEGMKAAGIDLTVAALRRELKLVDLVVLNSIDHWGLIGCSGFTAWGRCTKDGEILCARNFDFDVDQKSSAIVRLGLLLAFEPKDGQRFVSFGFPGMVGAVSAISEEGVGVFLHVGNGGFGGGEEGRSLPPTLLARQVVEECAPESAAARARELLAGARLRNSFLFRIVTPGGESPPTTVFEADPGELSEQRLPDESKGEPPFLVTTNHYLTRGAQFAVIPDSKVRWCNLDECERKCLGEGDRVIDPDEAWKGLDLVAQERGVVTLHSLVWRPRSQELWVSFAAVDPQSGRRIAAPRRTPVKLKFGELFGAR